MPQPWATIPDWDDAYANTPNIPQGPEYPARWQTAAASFRATANLDPDLPYGPHPRERFDLFLPPETPKGVLVFIHGGFWMAFDKSFWSHFAAGSLVRGWAVAMPSYTLCPQARISAITEQIGRAVTAIAARMPGPLVLAGHSAGGHLATRLVCTDSPLSDSLNIARVVSISGLHDLRPLLRTGMNRSLGLDEAEAASESPALRTPRPGVHLSCWVGGAERPEFIRQSELLANIWLGQGAHTRLHRAQARHHFNVLDDMTDPAAALMDELIPGETP